MYLKPGLLLDAITLLIHKHTPSNVSLVKSLVKLYEAGMKNKSSPDTELLLFYIRMIKEIITNKLEKQNFNEIKMILLKFKSDPALNKNRELYDLLYDMLMSSGTVTEERITQFIRSINYAVIHHMLDKKIRSTYGKVSRWSEITDIDEQSTQLNEIHDDLIKLNEDYRTMSAGCSTNVSHDIVDFRDKNSLKRAFSKHKERNVNGVIHLGLQGLNRSLGKANGVVLGESVVFTALSHHFKSGILMSIALWAAAYNTPKISETGLRPLILFISLENEAYQNTIWMTRHLYYTMTGVDSSNIPEDELLEWLANYFEEKGYSLVIERHLPDQFGYEELVQRITFYQNSGSHIHMTIIDYMNKMKLDPYLREDLKIMKLYSQTCNFMKNQGITLITAHQLKDEALKNRCTNMVKRFDMSLISNSRDVYREVDVLFFMHIEKNHEGIPYLTVKLDKHRYVDDTPESHKYFAYRFGPHGIPDDYGKSPGYVTDIYADDEPPLPPTVLDITEELKLVGSSNVSKESGTSSSKKETKEKDPPKPKDSDDFTF